MLVVLLYKRPPNITFPGETEARKPLLLLEQNMRFFLVGKGGSQLVPVPMGPWTPHA